MQGMLHTDMHWCQLQEQVEAGSMLDETCKQLQPSSITSGTYDEEHEGNCDVHDLQEWNRLSVTSSVPAECFICECHGGSDQQQLSQQQWEAP